MSQCNHCGGGNAELLGEMRETLARIDQHVCDWVGNDNPGFIPRQMDALKAQVQALELKQVNCKLECDTKIIAVREVAMNPPALTAAKQSARDRWASFRAWVVPLLAALLGAMIGRHR